MHDYFTITGNSCRIPFADLCRRDARYQSYFTKKEYQGSQCIHPQGTKINHFGIVVSGILKAVDNTLDGTETVSYTHLDVYKRQSTTCS